MAQVVQARCPRCQNMLRIPVEWLTQPMKCKHCQQIFQAKPRAGDIPIVAAPRAYRRRRSPWRAIVVLGLVLAITGAVVVFAVPQLTGLMGGKRGDEDASKVVAQAKGQGHPASTMKLAANAETKKKDNPKSRIEPKVERNAELPVEPTIEPKKVEPTPKPQKTEQPPSKNNIFPRRALLINVSNYLLFNPLHYGKERFGGFTRGAARPFWRIRLIVPLSTSPPPRSPSWLTAAGNAFPTTKPVIENTIADFTRHGSRPGPGDCLVHGTCPRDRQGSLSGAGGRQSRGRQDASAPVLGLRKVGRVQGPAKNC